MRSGRDLLIDPLPLRPLLSEGSTTFEPTQLYVHPLESVFDFPPTARRKTICEEPQHKLEELKYRYDAKHYSEDLENRRHVRYVV